MGRATIQTLLLVTALCLPVPAGASVSAEAHPPLVSQREQTRFLSAVLRHVEARRTRLARNTVRVVKRGAVQLEVLDRLTTADCRRLIQDNQASWRGVVTTDECAGIQRGGRVPAPILQRTEGFQTHNRVYLNPRQGVESAAATLVHEVNHVINRSHRRYRTPLQILTEEYRAFLVEHLFTHGTPPTPAEDHALRAWIIEAYALAGVHPHDIRAPLSGRLDNAPPTRRPRRRRTPPPVLGAPALRAVSACHR